MSSSRVFALVAGIAYLAVGVLGFVPAALRQPGPGDAAVGPAPGPDAPAAGSVAPPPGAAPLPGAPPRDTGAVVPPAGSGRSAAADRTPGPYPRLLGLFPVNPVHNVLHLAIGAWGLVAARAHRPARRYAATLAVIYGILAVMGLIPGLSTLFGLAPLFGHDVWLHGLTALLAAYFGILPGFEAELGRLRGRRG